MHISDLNDRNVELMSLVKNLTEQSKNDKDKIVLLQRSITALRTSLRRRDELVISMIDSLMPADFRNSGTLSNQEKQNIYSKAQKRNIVENLQNAIDENIMFMKVTTLKPDDIKAIKDKKQQFEKTWRSFGPKLIEIYSERGKKVKNAKEIDSAFEKWNSAIDQEAWSSIRKEFSDFDIRLNDYSNGMEFTRAMINYTQDKIKNIKTKSDSAVKDYLVFADTVWFGNIKPIWVPYLIDNNLLTSVQKDKIESGILKWKNVVYPVDYSWIYIVGSLLISIIIIVLIRRNYKKKNESLNSNDGVKE
jgi:predicted  nucleic acid-binding Zn-ribbon protein